MSVKRSSSSEGSRYGKSPTIRSSQAKRSTGRVFSAKGSGKSSSAAALSKRLGDQREAGDVSERPSREELAAQIHAALGEGTSFGYHALALVVDELQEVLAHAEEEARAISAHEQAAVVFAETLREVLGDRPLPAVDARRAALAAAAGTVWADTVGPLLSGQQVRELLGGVSRQRLEQLAKNGRLMVLEERSGEKRYPAWQFGSDGRPMEALVAAHHILVSDGQMSPWSAASWCVHEHPELDGRSPREWAAAAEDPKRLALAASRDAARSAQ